MRYPADETAAKHERILEEASRLFRERGFAGAGVAEVMKAAGLTHGAFYAHFASKEALAAEVAANAVAESRRLMASSAQGDTPQATYLRSYLSRTHRGEPGTGCAMAAFGSDMARQPESVRDAYTAELSRFFDEMGPVLAARYTEPAARRAEAIRLLSTLVGALTLARGVNDDDLAQEILRTVRHSELARLDQQLDAPPVAPATPASAKTAPKKKAARAKA